MELALKGLNALDDGYMPFESCRYGIIRRVTKGKRLRVKMRINKVGETWLIEKIFMVNALRNLKAREKDFTLNVKTVLVV